MRFTLPPNPDYEQSSWGQGMLLALFDGMRRGGIANLYRTARNTMLQPTGIAAVYLTAALSIIGAAQPAAAETWPTRPVTMVVPFAAGSSSDTAGRVIAVGLSEALGQQVIIENIGGGGGMT